MRIYKDVPRTYLPAGSRAALSQSASIEVRECRNAESRIGGLRGPCPNSNPTRLPQRFFRCDVGSAAAIAFYLCESSHKTLTAPRRHKCRF